MRSSVELVSCRNIVFGEGVFGPRNSGREGRMVDLAVLVYWRGGMEVRGGEGLHSSRAESHFHAT